MKAPEIIEAVISCPEIKTKTRLADICGVKPQAIQCWTRIPAEYCRLIERASKGAITRYQMRPDIFGPGPNDDSDLTAA